MKSLGAVLLCAALASSAQAVSINFEEQGLRGGLFSGEPPLTNQYSGLGVTFSGGWEILNQSGSFGVNALSGQHFAAFATGIPGITDTLTLVFASPISDIAGFVGDGSSVSWEVRAFSGATEVASFLGSNSAGSYLNFSLPNLAGLNVDRVTIRGNTNAAVLDDLSFNTTGVPEPGVSGLMGLGLAGIAVLRYRARRLQ